MKNLVRHIREFCSKCTLEEIIQFLVINGDIGYKSEQKREIYFFYLDSITMLKSKAKARKLTLLHFKITWRQFNNIRKRFE